MESKDVSSEGDMNSQQSVEAPGKISEEMTPDLEKTVVTTDNSVPSMDISMLNDYVMAHLFSYLPLADLKTCRLVNRSWNGLSNQAILKKNCVVSFPKYENGDRVIPIGLQAIPKLVRTIQTSSQFPWKKFLVDCFYIKQKSQLTTLFKVIGGFATEMRIQSPQGIPQNLQYPKLRKLDLYYKRDITIPSGCDQKSLMRLVEHASKLNEIAIDGRLSTPLFMNLLDTPNCRKVTRLTLFWWMEAKDLVRLSEMGLQLKYLCLAFELDKVTKQDVEAILLSQSTCLEELALSSDKDNHLGLECPRMEKLKILNVQSANLYARISYKQMFPALEKLIFQAYDPRYMDNYFNDDIEPVETVEYLRLNGNWARYPKRILQAAEQFPKLQRIYLMVDQNLLNIVGVYMPQLEEMELEFGVLGFVDLILTGFKREEMAAVKSLLNIQVDVEETNKQPVHYLRNLKRLRISSKTRRTEEALLSDFGCRFGLMKMENLQVLELKGYCHQISDQVMEIMREKFVVLLED